jgi:L-threonylcarbamoyladenylate synthase
MRRIEIVAVDAGSPDQTVIDRVAALLHRGGLVVAPTETRYGLLARADNERAIERLYKVKRRSRKVPTALFIEDYESVPVYGETNETTDRLASAFLPGPLTLVLKAVAGLHQSVVVAGKVGIRVSSSPVISSLLEQVDFPLTATSANLSGEQEMETADEIAAVFGECVDICLDAGPLAGPVSTVIDCSQGAAQVIRDGAVSERRIRRALGELS